MQPPSVIFRKKSAEQKNDTEIPYAGIFMNKNAGKKDGRWCLVELLNVVAIAIGLAMDACAVSITSAMSVKRLRIRYALRLCISFAFFQMLMPLIGWLAGIQFRETIAAVDHWVAFATLTLIGAKMIYESCRKKQEPQPESQEEISLRLLLVLSVATSIDALAVGVTFAFTGARELPVLLCDIAVIGAITFLICLAGTYIGKKFGDFLKTKAEIFGGGILIATGLKILIEHLAL